MYARLKVLPAACEVCSVLAAVDRGHSGQDRLPVDAFDHTLLLRHVHPEGGVTGRPSWPAGRPLCCCRRWQAGGLQTR